MKNKTASRCELILYLCCRRHSFNGLLFISKHFVLWHSLFHLHYTSNHNFISCFGKGVGSVYRWCTLTINSQQRGSTFNSVTINNQHCSLLILGWWGINSQQRGSTINSEPIDNQHHQLFIRGRSTVNREGQQSTLFTVDQGQIDDQQ